MHSAQSKVVGRLAAVAMLSASVVFGAGDFSGASALEFARRVVDFGPRPAGSEANRRLQAYIHAQLRLRHCQAWDDAFTADTPAGKILMRNIIARFPGSSGKAIVITGHYDTKAIPGIRFVGANDGGSSTAVLLELAQVLAGTSHADDIYLVWFDGEEAFGEWSSTNGIYGSRHLAARWEMDGTLRRVKALINVDMIGDKDLGILQEYNSSAGLRQTVWGVAQDFGYGRYFLPSGGGVEDDHSPFLQRGVRALDLIDFNYGPHNAYWHTAQDTLDKISAKSLQVVGDVLVHTIDRL